MTFAAEYPFLNILGSMILFFTWVIWIWMMVAILSDVFRRRDLSGWGKAGWAVFLIVLPFLGALIYLIGNSEGMAERNVDQVRLAQARGHGGAAAEIDSAKSLLDSGAINQSEFETLKARALA
jgi:phospholipase D-like protein